MEAECVTSSHCDLHEQPAELNLLTLLEAAQLILSALDFISFWICHIQTDSNTKSVCVLMITLIWWWEFYFAVKFFSSTEANMSLQQKLLQRRQYSIYQSINQTLFKQRLIDWFLLNNLPADIRHFDCVDAFRSKRNAHCVLLTFRYLFCCFVLSL